MTQNLSGPEIVKHLLEQRDGLFGFILALTHDREAAEEVFQAVGLVVVEEANRGTTVEKFLPWVHEIARRRVGEYFRKNSARAIVRLDSLDDAVAQAFEENAEDPTLRALRQDSLSKCIDELPPAQRRMVVSRYRDSASLRDIASSMDWTEGAVKVALWKVRQRLGDCVEGKLAAEGGE